MIRRFLRTHRNDVFVQSREVRIESVRVDSRYDSESQEVELKVLPLLTRRFEYIIEVALKLLF